MSKEHFSTKDWIPVGNYVMVKAIAIEHKEFVPDEMQEKIGWEILGFGTTYTPEEDLKIGDIVLVIEGTKKEGTLLTTLEGEIHLFPPHSVAAKIIKE